MKKIFFYFLITGLFSGPAHAPGRLNRPNMIITYNFRGFSDEKNVSLIFEVGPEGNREGGHFLLKIIVFYSSEDCARKKMSYAPYGPGNAFFSNSR